MLEESTLRVAASWLSVLAIFRLSDRKSGIIWLRWSPVRTGDVGDRRGNRLGMLSSLEKLPLDRVLNECCEKWVVSPSTLGECLRSVERPLDTEEECRGSKPPGTVRSSSSTMVGWF